MAEIIDTRTEPERAIERACAVLAEGEPVAIPTETVYGLAADATNPDAISRIYEMKGRPRFNPLISHVSDMAMAEAHVTFDLVVAAPGRSVLARPADVDPAPAHNKHRARACLGRPRHARHPHA